MFVVWAILTALLWSRCSCTEDNNDKWRRADTLLRNVNTLYTSIARHPYQDKNATMRHVSIVSLAIYNYIRKNNTDHAAKVNEAVSKTRENLNQTADVIASPIRSYIVVIQSLIQQPMTDVKASCPPSKPQKACDSDLLHMREKEEGKCNGYSKNVDLYKLVSDKQHAAIREDLMKILNMKGVSNDEDALSYFQRIAMTPDFKAVLKYMNQIAKMALFGHYPCRYPLILF